MAFTDEDLKILKDEMKLSTHEIDSFVLSDLLARLDAAEKVISEHPHLSQNCSPGCTWMLAWLKSKGQKEGAHEKG